MWWPSHQLGGRSQPSQMQPFVAEGDGSADGGGEGSGFAADVQDFAVAAEDGGDDFGVAEESAGLGGAQGSAGVVGGVFDGAGEGFPVEGDAQVGSFAAVEGSGAGVEVAAEGGDEGVGVAVGRWAGVFEAAGSGLWCGERVEGFADDFDAMVVELSFDGGQSGAGVAAVEGEFHFRRGGALVEFSVGVGGGQNFAGDLFEGFGVELVGFVAAQWPLALVSMLAYWLSSNTGRAQLVFKFLQIVDGPVQVAIVGQLPGKVADILQDLVSARP